MARMHAARRPSRLEKMTGSFGTSKRHHMFLGSLGLHALPSSAAVILYVYRVVRIRGAYRERRPPEP